MVREIDVTDEMTRAFEKLEALINIAEEEHPNLTVARGGGSGLDFEIYDSSNKERGIIVFSDRRKIIVNDSSFYDSALRLTKRYEELENGVEWTLERDYSRRKHESPAST